MTRIVAPRVVAAVALPARVFALIGICAVIAIAGFVPACDRVVDLTPFYDAPPVDAPLTLPDSGFVPDAAISIPADGGFPRDTFPQDAFPDGNPTSDGNSDGSLESRPAADEM
jgi:hypothetical protein